MRRAALSLLVAVAVLGAPAAASAASVDVLVVGRLGTLVGPQEVELRKQRPKVGGHRCAVSARTPLAALLGLRARIVLKDYGSCGRSVRDAGGLFVQQVGPDRNRGQNGWVYKVGRRAGTAPAADLSGAFGDGKRLRDGQRVTWYWCVLSSSDACQRTLEASPAERTVDADGDLRVTVRGFDDAGRGVLVEGATVHLGSEMATTGEDGVAEVRVPSAARGELAVWAEKTGTVRSFGRHVTVR